jgi:hypothetical protein
MKAMTLGEWEALPYQCARNLPSCRGEVRLYRQPLRSGTHRLCEQCVSDLSGSPLHLSFVEFGEPTQRPSLVRFIPFGGAA